MMLICCWKRGMLLLVAQWNYLDCTTSLVRKTGARDIIQRCVRTSWSADLQRQISTLNSSCTSHMVSMFPRNYNMESLWSLSPRRSANDMNADTRELGASFTRLVYIAISMVEPGTIVMYIAHAELLNFTAVMGSLMIEIAHIIFGFRLLELE